MALDDLNDKLHSRDLHLDRVRKPDTFSPTTSQPTAETVSGFEETETWNKESIPKDFTLPAPVREMIFVDAARKKRRKKIALILGSIAGILLLAGVAMKLRSALFNEENLKLFFTGPAEVKSTELSTFTFEYENSNWLILKDATVIFEYPETFHPEPKEGLVVSRSRAEMKAGDIAASGKGSAVLAGKFYGARGDQATLRAILRYTPSNTTSSYEKPIERSVKVISSPLFFEINAPQELANDQELEYEVLYGNKGDLSFSNLKVKMDYPAGFTFVAAEPKATEGEGVWHIGTLTPGQEGKIVVRGRLAGARDEQKSVHGGIGFFQGDGNFIAYGENVRKTRVVASPFMIRQTVNEKLEAVVSPGDTLRYNIEYRNEGNVGIRDAIVTVELDSPYVDFKTLNFDTTLGRGAYNAAQKTISWKASDVAELSRIAPGEKGQVGFSIQTYTDPEKRGGGLKNPRVRSIAKIDSPDIPALTGLTKVVASNTLEIKISSAVSAETLAYYQDTVIPNTGPIPPVVGQETTYTFHMRLSNTSNDVNDAKVSIILPTKVRYTGKKLPDTERVVFNERSNELIWDVGVFTAQTSRELVFQIGITPDPSMADQTVTLMSKATFTGKDSFTGQEFRLEKKEKTSNIPEDPSVGPGKDRVQAAP